MRRPQFLLCTLLLFIAHGSPGAGRAKDSPAPLGPQDILEQFDVDKEVEGIFLPVRVHGKTYTFLLDTGASETVFDISLRHLLGKAIATNEMATAGNNMEVEFFRCPGITIGKLHLEAGTPVGVLDMKILRQAIDVDVRGVLGMDFLQQHILHINLDRGTIAFLRKSTSHRGSRVPILYDDLSLPEVELNVPPLGRRRFLVDTGMLGFSSGGLNPTLFQSLLEGKRLAILGDGIGGTASGIRTFQNARVRQIALGAFEHRDLIFPEGRFNLLGLPYWSRFIATFDFPSRVVYLERSERYSLPDELDRSGLHLWRVDGQARVAAVDSNSPASIKGIKAGDVVVKCAARELKNVKLDIVRRLLCSPGKTVQITIQRGTEQKDLTLSLPK